MYVVFVIGSAEEETREVIPLETEAPDSSKVDTSITTGEQTFQHEFPCASVSPTGQSPGQKSTVSSVNTTLVARYNIMALNGVIFIQCIISLGFAALTPAVFSIPFFATSSGLPLLWGTKYEVPSYIVS